MKQPVEIIGGGLAGLSLGLALRRAGVPARVFESGAYPRHRVCGEFITGLSAGTIRSLGIGAILADARRHREVAWFIRERPSRIQQLPAPALALSRHALDARLADAFVAAGGVLRTGTRVTEFDGAGQVIATGRRRGRSRWLGLKMHVQGLALVRDLELHLGDNAYVGLSGVENDRVNVCGFFRQRPLGGHGAELLTAYLRAAGLAKLALRLEKTDVDAESFCAVAALSVDRGVARSRQVRLGDACAMIPPFTGDGMAMAFQSAEIALAPLISYSSGKSSWAETARGINDSLRREFRLRLASATALHPFLLRTRRQGWLAALNRARLLPLRPLYTLLH